MMEAAGGARTSAEPANPKAVGLSLRRIEIVTDDRAARTPLEFLFLDHRRISVHEFGKRVARSKNGQGPGARLDEIIIPWTDDSHSQSFKKRNTNITVYYCAYGP